MSYKKVVFFILSSLVFFSISCSKSCSKNTSVSNVVNEQPKQENIVIKKEMEQLMQEFNLKNGDKLLAKFDTSKGEIAIELFWDKAPITVKNFVDLATGKKEWQHPITQEKSTKPLYNGTIFHRVIKNFMIQGGDPAGSGFGGPGYKFKDEFHPELKHDKKGILSMANSGPNSNGSQFFITEVATPHLNGRHTVFGQTTDENSLKVIDSIAASKTGPQDKPIESIVINKIEIIKQ